MRIADEFANVPTLATLPISKIYALLDVPAEERQTFIEQPHEVKGQEKTVDEMTTRELQAAIVTAWGNSARLLFLCGNILKWG